MIRVYGWIGYRREVGTHHNQTREIVAARSMAEVGRIVGEDPRRLHNLTDTANAEEIAVATAAPGEVRWSPLDAHPPQWHTAEGALISSALPALRSRRYSPPPPSDTRAGDTTMEAPTLKRCPGFEPEPAVPGEYRQEPHSLSADTTNFNSNKGSKDGLSVRCRPCGNAYGKAWAKAKKAGTAFSLRAQRASVAGEEPAAAGIADAPPSVVSVSAVAAAPKYHDQLAVAAHRGKAHGYTAELVGDTWYALPSGNGEVTSPEGQAALAAVNEARANERKRRDAERKRAERAAAKEKAAATA